MRASWISICLVPIACAILCGAVNRRQYTELPAPDSNLNIYALPIGQGDCTIIQCPANRHHYNLRKRSLSNDQLQATGGKRQKLNDGSSNVRQSRTQSPPPTSLTVVDMGAVRRQYMSVDDLSSFLGDQKRYVEVVAISHPDADHYNYIPDVFPVDTLSELKGVYIGCTKYQYPGHDHDESTMRGWLSAAENDDKLTFFGDGKQCTTNCPAIKICGGMATLKMLGANLGDAECRPRYRNSNSLVLRLEYGESFKLFLPGDFEDTSSGSNSGVQLKLINAWGRGGIQADFYKLAHHGAYQGGISSKTKANKDHFLKEVSPKYVFSSSAAPPNSYNHPHCSLYERLLELPSISIVRGNMLTNSQTYYTCGRNKQKEVKNNNFGIYTTSPEPNIPTIIHIATNGETSSIEPVPYRST